MSDTSNIACLSHVKRSGVLKLKRLTYVCRVARPVHIVHSVTLTYNPRPTPLCSSQSNFLNQKVWLVQSCGSPPLTACGHIFTSEWYANNIWCSCESTIYYSLK